MKKKNPRENCLRGLVSRSCKLQSAKRYPRDTYKGASQIDACGSSIGTVEPLRFLEAEKTVF